MYLATDYTHSYKGSSSVRSCCRIRLYLPYEDTDAAVVICSELPNNPGTPVTDAAEQLVAEVIAHFRLPAPPVWIEHHPEANDETFDLVTFAHYEVRTVLRGGILRKEIGAPTWKRLDREAVEMLVGQPV